MARDLLSAAGAVLPFDRHRQHVELDIRILNRLLAPHKCARLSNSGRGWSGTEKGVLEAVSKHAQTPILTRVADRFCGVYCNVHLELIVKILADTWQVADHRHAHSLQLVCWADS